MSTLTASILVTEVRKAPNVAQIDGKANNGKEKVDLFSPSFSPVIFHRHRPIGLCQLRVIGDALARLWLAVCAYY